MEKINYYKQEQDLADRLFRLLEKRRNYSKPKRQAGLVTEPASSKQLAKLGIYPKWQATRYEADEMLCNYRTILRSVNRIPW